MTIFVRVCYVCNHDWIQETRRFSERDDRENGVYSLFEIGYVTRKRREIRRLFFFLFLSRPAGILKFQFISATYRT